MCTVATRDAKRRGHPEPRERPLLNSVDRILAYLAAAAAGGVVAPRVLLLDAGNQLLAEARLAGGEAPAALEEAVRRAREAGAAAMVLVGPQGEAAPCDADVLRAIRLHRVAVGAGIVLHDHVLLGAAPPVSLRRLGLMPGMLRVNQPHDQLR